MTRLDSLVKQMDAAQVLELVGQAKGILGLE